MNSDLDHGLQMLVMMFELVLQVVEVSPRVLHILSLDFLLLLQLLNSFLRPAQS